VAEAEAFVPGVLRGPRLPLLRWWLGQRQQHGALLARLFVYDDRLTESEACAALGSELLEALLGAGLLASASEREIAARFLVTPLEGALWLVSDALGASPDSVMGPGGGTQYLARLLCARPRDSVLDVGTGAGTLALVAARAGARRAVGVDLNPRAIALARFNARLNGLRAEFHVGDAVEPVASESFQLVVSQPPYVVRPPEQGPQTFLFGGATGDELPLHFLRGISGLLCPGGRAYVLLQSATREGQPLAPRLREAIGDRNVDLLCLVSSAPPPAVQASVFASFEDPSLGERYAATARRYLDHFESLSMRAFDGALVALSRAEHAAQSEGTYTLGLKVGSVQQDPASLEAFLSGLELLERPAKILERERLRLSPHASVLREVRDTGGDVKADFVVRIAAPGIGSEWPLTSDELEVLSRVDRAASVGQMLREVAAKTGGLGAPARERLHAFIRSALVRGVLVRPQSKA
jgi:methylase of polypeptide subunit release factors